MKISSKKKKIINEMYVQAAFLGLVRRETDLTLSKFPFLLMKRENKAANINYLRIMVEVPTVEENTSSCNQ